MATQALAHPDAFTDDQLALIKRTVAKDATNDELALFLYDCQRRGVHPLDKLLHFTKRGGRYTPVTSIDFMRAQAAVTGEMAGSDDPVFHPKPTGADPEKFLPPSAASVTVYRITQGQRFAYTATARWAEYCPENAPMWKRMPHTMLGKCAEALALRKAFPQQLQGLYAREEMDQADTAARPVIAPLAPPESVLDAVTGAEVPASDKPTPPDGYHYIDSYGFSGGWHELTILSLDSQGGAMKLSTKKAIGYGAAEAYQGGIPVKVTWSSKPNGAKGEGYLDTLTKWVAQPYTDEPLIDGTPLPF